MRAYDRARMTLHAGASVAPLSQDASRSNESREGTKSGVVEVVQAFPTSTFERVKYAFKLQQWVTRTRVNGCKLLEFGCFQ
jgi:hypothetical protein